MSKDILIDALHPEEVRIAVVCDGKLDKFDFEISSKAQIKGNIYLAKVIKVEPSLQAAFVDYGGNKHGFLSFSEIHHDYFQIPVGDREELEAHIQNALNAYAIENDKTVEEIDPKDIVRLRYQFYRRYKIQEVIKKRQIMLVQVTKEERGNKGAAITTYISLAGRYCVLMPNTEKGSGISRKITSISDRTKLKKIVSDLKIENGSVVIRTAGVGHTKSEIKKDFDYLVNMWNAIRKDTLKSTAPCLIHEESSIIKRSLRDMYTKDIDEIIVEGEEGYKVARSFMKKLIPSHVKKVKLYEDKSIPLFSKYKVNEQTEQIYSTRVELPSGGYLVINNTEALIAIDVNSGKSTKERNISGTALKTNLEAAVEIARQCRLRDLAGLVVVDFIDMEGKHSNIQVERCIKEAFRNDKAKIQLGSISNFGLLEFSRQRLRSSITDANMVVCPYCQGTGFMWSDEALAVRILRQVEESCIEQNIQEVVVTLSPSIALYLLNNKRSFISMIESRGDLKITFKADSNVTSVNFHIEKIFKLPTIEEENTDELVETNLNEVTSTNKRNYKKIRTDKQNDKSEAEEVNIRSTPIRKNLRRNKIRKNDSKVSSDFKENEQLSNDINQNFIIKEEIKEGTEPIAKEGKVDLNFSAMMDEYQQDIASKVVESYRKEINEMSNIQKGMNITPPKRIGWWQKLLQKPKK